MKKRFIAAFLFMAAVSLAGAQTPDDPSNPPDVEEPAPVPDDAPGQYGGPDAEPVDPDAPIPVPAMVPAKKDSASSGLPAFPPMRNVITTEKPVKGVSAGVIPRERSVSLERPSDPDAVNTRNDAPVPDGPGPGTASGETQPPAKRKSSGFFMEERSLFNAPTDNLRTAKVIIDNEYTLVGMVYGEQFGYLHILDADADGGFTERWKSPPLNGEIRGVFVENLDGIGESEIVAYTANGNIFIYGYDSHEMKFRTTDGLYKNINCMLIGNVDASPEKEILFITDESKLIQFDPISKFEEWKSTETYTATDMVIGNVDNDPAPELILNTGEILSLPFKALKWKMDVAMVGANSRLYLLDADRDGILELVVEYNQQYIRIFDIDQRHEKW